MDRKYLIARLEELAENSIDEEDAHSEADELLLLYIDDFEIQAAYEAVPKWYA